MDRLVRRNVLAMSGRAVEAAGDVNTLLLDKTGTITYGARQAAEFRPAPGRGRARARRRRAALEPRRRDAGRALDRRCSPQERYGLVAARDRRRDARRVHRPDPDERRRLRRHAASARAPPTPCVAGSRRTAARCRSSSMDDGRRDRRPRRHAARRRDEERRDRDGARGDLPQGHGQAGHERAVRRAPHDGHPDRDGDRRQPDHRRGHRGGGRRRRLHRRGDARGEDGLHQATSRPGAGSSR